MQKEDFIDFVLDKQYEKSSVQTYDDFWDSIPHSGLLYKLTNETWGDFVRSHEKVLVIIYSEDCPNCQQIRQELAECAKMLFEKKMNVQLAVINGDKFTESIYRLWTLEMGVPTLFWYEKGKKQFEYIKSRHATDLFRFLQNPIKPEVKPSYPDWSMQESAESIFHYTDQGFNEFASDQEDMMVFFYSPGCSKCFKLRKIYEEAAQRLDDEKPSVTMAAVNIAEALVVKDKYSITSYPHFAYFHNGKYKFQYNGKLDVDSIVEFMKRPKYIDKPADFSTSQEEGGSNVTQLTKDTFDDFITTHEHVMLAADLLKEKNSPAHLAALDGEDGKKFLKRYKVFGFPTVLYFKKGEVSTKYTGKRNSEDVVKFINDVTNQQKLVDEDEIKTSKPTHVHSLSPETFDNFLLKHDDSFVMFYSKTCGACKSAKKGFYGVAVNIKEDEEKNTGFGIFDAALHHNHVSDYDIKGYPTFWYFVGKDKKFKYKGEYSSTAFFDFLNNPRELEEVEQSTSNNQWISELGQVEHPNLKNFDKFLRKYQRILVFFYINVCEICLNKIKPEYTKAAEMLHSEGAKSIKLAAINGGWEKELMRRFDVDSFPTLLYFEDEKFKYQYHGSWKANDLVKFMKHPQEKLAKKIKPTSWQDMDSMEYGKVVHLGNQTYDGFLAKHNKAVVMFHSLYYQRCKKAREEFKKLADQMSRQDIGFGAVDCHRKPEQGLVCYHLSVKKFPIYKYYEDGKFVSDVSSDQTENIVSFLKEKLSLHEKDEL